VKNPAYCCYLLGFLAHDPSWWLNQ
jgi:hypothetical protein